MKRTNPIILTEEDIDNFWSKVQKTDDCWLWTAARTSKGYGKSTSERKDSICEHQIRIAER